MGLVQAIVERMGEELGVAEGDRGAEQGGPPDGRGGILVGHDDGQGAARGGGGGALPRNDCDGRERERVGDARRRAVPGKRHAPGERGRKVVGVILEAEPQGQQLVEGRIRRGGCQPERDCGCRRAEPALERDPVEEPKLLARRVGEKRERANREIRARPRRARPFPRPR